jgi:hypothetical protein
MDRETALRRLYAAFNARDIDTTLAGMTPDVDWANGWEGGYLKGHDEVRAYWTRQWAEVDSRAEPLAITTRPDGRVEVRAHLVGRGFEHEATHVYTFRDDLVAHMAIE